MKYGAGGVYCRAVTVFTGAFSEMTLSVVVCGYAIGRDTMAVPFRNLPIAKAV
jgi:hypothetical protein